MDRNNAREIVLALNGAEETFPFGQDVGVFKVAGKMFALIPVGADSISLKCDPLRAEILRTTFPAITPGYHLNKRHWNTIQLDGSVPDDEIIDLIEHSYELVVAKLPRKVREQLLMDKN